MIDLRRRPLAASFAVISVVALSGYAAMSFYDDGPLVEIAHAPSSYARRAADFTANITGLVSERAKSVEYRLNDGAWHPVENDPARVPKPLMTIEMAARDLKPGDNTIAIRAAGMGRDEAVERKFRYDDGPVSLPRTMEWAPGMELDAQDGSWEVYDASGEWRVRPKPGHEGYDRVLVVTGAFAGGRKVTTDVVFRGASVPGKPYGFGVLPLWGGRPAVAEHRLRQGWIFSLGWYYSHYEGVGMEFSTKHGDDDPLWVASYRNIGLRTGIPYRLTIEVWPEKTANGGHRRFRQRMTWQAADEPPISQPMEVIDTAGAPLPDGEYAVALIAHRSRVDFGPVTVEPMAEPSRASDAPGMGQR